jgi:hypothetical protein
LYGGGERLAEHYRVPVRLDLKANYNKVGWVGRVAP